MDRRYPGNWSGNVVNDPEFSTSEGGQACLAFRFAEDRIARTEDGWGRVGTSYYDVVVWGGHATRLAELLHKGDAIDMRGDLEVQHWLNNDSKPRTGVRIVADKVSPDWTRMKVSIDRTPRNTSEHVTIQRLDIEPEVPVQQPQMKSWPMPAQPDAGMAL